VDRRAGALIGSFVFFWIAPAMVAGYVPWLLTRWRAEAPLLGVAAGRSLGYANARPFAALAMIAATTFGWDTLDGVTAVGRHDVVSNSGRFCRRTGKIVAARVQGNPEAVGRRIRCCSLR
jgi:hypothetical protein